MSIPERLADADLLWRHHRREGALLSVLVATAATARKTFPNDRGDRSCFEAFMKSTHDWDISVEYRGDQVSTYHLFYKWLRSELVHTAALPTDLRIDDDFADVNSCSIRAGGAPEHTLLLSPGWYGFLVSAVRYAPANADIHWPTTPQHPIRSHS